MGNLSRLLLLFGAPLAMAGVALAQEDYPPADPYAQPQQADPYAQQADPYAQQQPEYEQQPQAYEYAFMGAHPVPYDQGGGYCYQTVAHYHPYAPFDQYLFRESNGYWYFVGDPGDFGYSQQLWGYNGNHPIPLSWGGGYCYISWGHRHPYAPPSSLYFNFVGGYYNYNGPWDPGYWRFRDRYYGYYGNYYRNNYYGGRYWTVRPPAVYRPTITVGAPGVRVVGRPGVVVGAPPVRVGAPPVRGGVVVGAPPVRGGVVVGAPPVRGGVVVTPPARPYAPAPAHNTYAPPARTYAPPPAHTYAPPPAQHYTPPAARPTYTPPPAQHSAPPPARSAPPPARHR